jgi:hypothetical protein
MLDARTDVVGSLLRPPQLLGFAKLRTIAETAARVWG